MIHCQAETEELLETHLVTLIRAFDSLPYIGYGGARGDFVTLQQVVGVNAVETMSSFYVASGGDADDNTWGPGACTSLHQLHGLKRLTLSQVLAKKRRKEKIVMCTVRVAISH